MNVKETMLRCTRCILPDSFPNIKYDEAGVCNYCHSWDSKWKNFDYQKSESELVSLFKWAKAKKRKYDCLIPYSGGRDSSYVVYLIRKKYNLNPLVVTFNNLFISQYALENIFHMVEILNVDHLFVTYRPALVRQFYKAMVKNAGEFCSICAAGINYVKYVYQKLFNIPLVITGTSSRVDEQSPFEVNTTHPLYVRKVLKRTGFDEEMICDFVVPRHFEWGTGEKIKRKIKDSDYIEISLPDFIEWKNDNIYDTLIKDLKWKSPSKESDHIDCKFAPMKEYLKNKQIPNFIFKQEKFSQLIRDGQMTRDQALEMLDKLIGKESEKPKEYDDFLNFMALNSTDIEELGSRSHLNYVSKEELGPKQSVLFKAASMLWKVYKLVRIRFS